MKKATIGIIGGTGLYGIEGLTNVEEVDIETPFGKPSDTIITGQLNDRGIAFLPRHGRGHQISPTEIPVRANVYALKSLGVKFIIAVNTVGSFKEGIAPGHLLIPNQIIDRTRSRVNTFFEGGIVAHIPFADPFCPVLSYTVYQVAKEIDITVHFGGTYIAMEGPAFSTRAESKLYQSWNADVIGMTALPEAKIVREAEICYSIIACVTDYDSWQKTSQPIDVSVILKVLRQNVHVAKKIIERVIGQIPESRTCECATALKTALVTNPQFIRDELKNKYRLLIDKYIKE